MAENEPSVVSAKPKLTPYEKVWWMWMVALVGCFVAMSTNLSTAHTPEPVPMTLVWLTFLMSALLGIYSLALFTRLPKAMAILGIIQGGLLGFNVFGRFLVAWFAKVTA